MQHSVQMALPVLISPNRNIIQSQLPTKNKPDVTLADKNARVMHRLSEAELEHLSAACALGNRRV